MLLLITGNYRHLRKSKNIASINVNVIVEKPSYSFQPIRWKYSGKYSNRRDADEGKNKRLYGVRFIKNVYSARWIKTTDIKKALDELYASETFQRLNDPACGLYYESDVYVFSYLQNEIEQGVLK